MLCDSLFSVIPALATNITVDNLQDFIDNLNLLLTFIIYKFSLGKGIARVCHARYFKPYFWIVF